MASVATVFRKDKLNKKGQAPIHFRIIKNRKISYIASGIMLEPEFWDEEKNRVKSKYPNSMRVNSLLSNKFTDLQDEVLKLETYNKELTTKQLKHKIHGSAPTDFFEYANRETERYMTGGKIGTYDKNRSIIQKLRNYAGENRNLHFQEIDVPFLLAYEKYLREKIGNTTNTVHKDFKYIRKLFNDAIRADLIASNLNPFLRYQMKAEKTAKVYLSLDELQQIESYKPTAGTRLELHKDMFVFACYVGGLRVSDTLKLKWKNYDNTHIRFTIHKTKQQLSILVPEKARAILAKYKPQNENPEAFIFPVLPTDLDMSNSREVDTAISRATAYLNKNLKILAKNSQINKSISFHTSRHTFATLALTKGISIDKVSKLMGHANLRETQVYAKIINEELDRAMEVFNN